MALKELRTASRSWAAGILIGLLVISFAVWGVADIFSGRQSRGVARVGDTWISHAQFQQRYRAEIDLFRQQTGQQLTPEQAQTFGITNRVLDFLIDIAAVEEFGRRIGLAAHDDTVTQDILSTPAFQGIDGTFDPLTYERVLRENGYTTTAYEDSLRGDVVRQQMVRTIMEGTRLPRGLIEVLLRYNAERREVSYVTVPASLVEVTQTPSDEDLQSFIEARPDEFSTPEVRDFVAILLTPEDFAAEVTLSDEEIQQQYDFDIARYTVPEKRAVRIMAFPNEGEAKAAHDRLTAGETFEDIGAERGLEGDALAFADQTQSDIADTLVAEATFAAAEPGLLAPINGQLAWNIVEIQSITPGREQPLDEVKEEIRESLSLTRSEDLIYEIINTIEDGRAEGQTLEEIAERLDVKLVKGDKIAATGEALDGQTTFEAPGDNTAAILEDVFSVDEGQENDFRLGAEGSQFVTRVDLIEPPTLRPLVDVRADALAAFQADARRGLIQERAQTLLNEAQAGSGLAGVAEKTGSEFASLDEPITRETISEVLSASLIADLFAAELGELAVGRVPNSDDWVIAGVTAIVEPRTEEIAAGVTQVGPQLDLAASNNLAEQFVIGVREDLGARVDQNALNQSLASGVY